ncbi:MAG TPA: LytTR family DNA-binding domain-containing protein [Bryobacterales bacterium]|nr:LytTR family DNA-binding domain-containing protein [Bryobacterales bacterium]
MPDKQSATATLSVLVADDEQLAREELCYLLREQADVEVVATAANGLEALELIRAQEPDLVLLDVQMPGLDGLGVVRRLLERGERLPHFIFTTAYDQYAVKAFEVDAVDYLLKPIDKARLAVSLDRVRRLLEAREESPASHSPAPAASPPPAGRTKLLVKHAGRLFLVDSDDVIYATIDDGVITIVAAMIEGQSNYRTIEELQSSLDPASFWRAHRSYLVNINKIKEVVPWFKSSYQLRMDDKKHTEIPVSRAQTRRLRELLKL